MLKQIPKVSWIVVLLWWYCGTNGYSQQILETKLTLNVEKATVVDVFEIVRTQGVEIAYSGKMFKSKQRFSFTNKTYSLQSLLSIVLKDTNLKYAVVDEQIIIEKKKNYTISGTIKDAETQEALTAATIYQSKVGVGTYTNEYGFYSLTLPEGKHDVTVQYLGKAPQVFTVNLSKSERRDIELVSDISLAPVIVTQSLETKELANAPLNQKTITELTENTPHIGGDPDLLHVLRGQAGVQSSAGGIGGLYVRGGNSGHNLVLLDGVPVYNWMHLLGMNSIFSPNAVRGVQFHTSGFSARYGGRLSSVIDIQSKEGNFEKWSGYVGMNQRSIQGSISGRTFKNGSFWIGGRTSTFAPYVRSILTRTFFLDRDESSEITPKYSDFNLKINQRLGKNNRLYFAFYEGSDEIVGSSTTNVSDSTVENIENQLSYGNTIWSLRWNHIYGKRLFSNLIINASTFRNSFAQLNDITNTASNSGIPDFFYTYLQSLNTESSIKMDFDLYLKKHQIRFGVGLSNYFYRPFVTFYNEQTSGFENIDTLTFDSLAQTISVLPNYAAEFFAYAEDKIHLSDHLELNLGLRLSSYYTNNANYKNLEPRFSLKYNVNNKWTAFLSATRMVQYLHLISNTDIGLPQDFWLPSNELYHPEVAWQYGLDVQTTCFEGWKLKGALFFKEMTNLLTFPETISTVSIGNNINDQFVSGQGRAYGLELSAYFQNEKFNVLGTYTLSRSVRRFRAINKGFWFPFQFDARHYLQAMGNYKLNDKWSLGMRGHFSTPRPRLVSAFARLEYGLSRVNIDPSGNKNKTRGEFENRIDININRVWQSNKKKLSHRASFDLYNIYNRKNAVFFYQISDTDKNYSPGLNMPFMASFNYTMKF